MRKSLVTPLLIALLALLISGGSALAAATSGSVIVSPGARVCSTAIYGGYKVRADGQATNPGVRWTLNRSADGVNYTQISQSPSDYTTAYAAAFNSSLTPAYFPGYFKLCMRNVSTGGVTVTFALKTDANAP